MTRLLLAAAQASLAALLLASPVSAHNGGKAHSEYGHPGNAARATRTVSVDLSEYAFKADALSFKLGETVRFVITNNGHLKHEMTIGSEEEQLEHRKEMQAMSDMHHNEMTHEMPANSLHIEPGKKGELVWQFTKAGTLQIACNYPGHADLGMQQNITVE